MTIWKLMRQEFGTGEFLLTEGEDITVGRGANNNITLTSIVVSRNHCILNVQKEKVLITDLKSSNGVYVGTKKIPQNVPYELEESDVIGIGWTIGAPAADISDDQKYVFKLIKETQASSASRIRFQSENEDSNIEAEIAALEQGLNKQDRKRSLQSPILESKTNLKRKFDLTNDNKEPEIKKNCSNIHNNPDIINISDSEPESKVINLKSCSAKVAKIESVSDAPIEIDIKIETKPEIDEIDFEAFKVKQEYYDIEPIEIESDNESEDDQWAFRLSQSSPGKPVIKAAQSKKTDIYQEDNSYSQLDDFLDDKEILEDIIYIPPHPPDVKKHDDSRQAPNVETTELSVKKLIDTEINELEKRHSVDKDKNLKLSLKSVNQNERNRFENIVKPFDKSISTKTTKNDLESVNKDQVDGIAPDHVTKDINTASAGSAYAETPIDKGRKIQMIDLPLLHQKKTGVESKSKSISKSKSDRRHSSSSSKRHISNSQKEERKKRLKEIAEKEKVEKSKTSSSNSKPEKPIVNAKVTASNRGAFLSDVAPSGGKSIAKKNSPHKRKDQKKVNDTLPKTDTKCRDSNENIENKKKNREKTKSDHKSSKNKSKQSDSKRKSVPSKTETTSSIIEPRKPLKSLKPLTDSEESFAGKPFSIVEPLSHQPKKPKKNVRFSEQAPTVIEFEIDEGNKMKKTSLAKTRLIAEHTPVFSLEKMTLMKILRWNPSWLEEQMKFDVPPPILGHNNTPMTIFHSFNNHAQYVQQVGDLLLMEIWECLTQGHIRLRNQAAGLEMRVATVPPTPAQERHLELFNISVDISVPNTEMKRVPRTGEIMTVDFGPPNNRNRRFFFVHNVRCLPSPPNNVHAFFSISLHACYTEKMKLLRPGEVMIGFSLAYINNELMLFDAMEYLAGSPLSEAILRPEPRHFVRCDPGLLTTNIQWTKKLNPSQQMAVNASLAAALGDRPSIQMVQGPPGTGKSSVICAIVMSYFYDSNGRRQQNRGKILICATSNTAVDEIVIRLLSIRKDLPKTERFRMVRVGRAEAMHPRARDVSSQMLAQRDASRATEPADPAANEEILYLEAKRNMWRTQALDAQAAKNPERVAYCQTKVNQLNDRIALVRSGAGGGGVKGGSAGGGALSGEALSRAERRIIEGADIVVTTLASAHNAKMRGLKRRIALCIIDEAGQAIEPETLIPLTLDVTRLTLIGDPQQLPGFICSQRAKKHGLGESLFARLAQCAEGWAGSNCAVHLLRQQYRMHAAIAEFPNRAFYDGQVTSAGPPRPNLALPPYKLLAICSGDRGQVMGANEIEAWAVTRVVGAAAAAIARAGAPLSIAVITPYNAHKDLIKNNLKHVNDPACAQVEVNTVDSFQGQERDVVIVSLARSSGVGFLTDAGRMNVMLTRARHSLLVCLNPHAIMKNPLWRSLVDDAQKRNLYRELPNRMCQPHSNNKVSVEEVLSYINDSQKERGK